MFSSQSPSAPFHLLCFYYLFICLLLVSIERYGGQDIDLSWYIVCLLTGVVLTLAIPAVNSGTAAAALKSPLIPMGSAHGHTGHVRFLTSIELPESFGMNFPPTPESTGKWVFFVHSYLHRRRWKLFDPSVLQATSPETTLQSMGAFIDVTLLAAEPPPTFLQKPIISSYLAAMATRTSD